MSRISLLSLIHKAKASPEQQEKIHTVMHEYHKENNLHSGSHDGPLVKDRDQAVAIAMSEAGLSKKKKGKKANKSVRIPLDQVVQKSTSGVAFVGTTRTGKPIDLQSFDTYEGFARDHQYFTADDHSDASRLLGEIGWKLSERASKGENVANSQILIGSLAKLHDICATKKSEAMITSIIESPYATKQSEPAGMAKSFSRVSLIDLPSVAKAVHGEGARGGKVIGHTKSGKPIYDKFDHPGHKDFTPKEHEQAAMVHDHHDTKISQQIVGRVMKKEGVKDTGFYGDTDKIKNFPEKFKSEMTPDESAKRKYHQGQSALHSKESHVFEDLFGK